MPVTVFFLEEGNVGLARSPDREAEPGLHAKRRADTRHDAPKRVPLHQQLMCVNWHAIAARTRVCSGRNITYPVCCLRSRLLLSISRVYIYSW
jgi:hypothetical protein